MLAVIDLGSAWDATVSATVMLSTVGLIAAALIHRFGVTSWRLRSWLLMAVLLQGLMFYRAPIHLGWLPSPSPSAAELAAIDAEASEGSLHVRATLLTDDRAQPRPERQPLTGLHRDSRPIGWSWSRLLASAWLTVAFALVATSVIRYLRLLGHARRLRLAPPAWQREWESVAQGSHKKIDYRCQMFISDEVGPLMLRRPGGYCLIVPAEYWSGLSEAQRTAVMLHERSHLDRHDVWKQLAARVVVTIHWFNPVAWWALHQYEQACEWACDHRVARQGRVFATGFASALVELIQWHQTRGSTPAAERGVGFQAMATPPLSNRINRLLQSNSVGEPRMKRFLLAICVATLLALSFIQVRLTTAQNVDGGSTSPDGIRVLSEDARSRLGDVAAKLDRDDPTTERLAGLIDSTEGKIAIAGMLDQIRQRAREEARSDAVPRFIAAHFSESDKGRLSIRDDKSDLLKHWTDRSERLAEQCERLKETTDELAFKIDPSSEADGLLRRLLQDEQAPAAILLFEMKDGGDVISRFISQTLGEILVERGDGTLQVIESRREEAELHLDRFEMAGKISVLLQKQMPIWAAEFVDTDDQHRTLAAYFRSPMMASIVALHISEGDDFRSASKAVETLFQKLDDVSEDTADGLRIREEEVWTQFEEFFDAADRATSLAAPITERLRELADKMSPDDPLAVHFAEQLETPIVAVRLAAEIPYAEADPGAELHAMLSEVLTESGNGKLTVNADRTDEVSAKAKELLKVCRAIRRHVLSVDEMLERLDDVEFVEAIGDAGRYLILSEVRRYAEDYHPDAIALAQKELLTEDDRGRLRVREDRRDVIRRLVEQSEKVRSDASNDDF